MRREVFLFGKCGDIFGKFCRLFFFFPSLFSLLSLFSMKSPNNTSVKNVTKSGKEKQFDIIWGEIHKLVISWLLNSIKSRLMGQIASYLDHCLTLEQSFQSNDRQFMILLQSDKKCEKKNGSKKIFFCFFFVKQIVGTTGAVIPIQRDIHIDDNY